MTSTDLAGAYAPEGAARARSPLYFAVWRWHFYAGLYVVPFLLMLAITGTLMMWFTTIRPEAGDAIPVVPKAAELSVADQEKAARAAVPGATGLVAYTAPRDAAKPALFEVATGEGSVKVALDPYDGRVLRQGDASQSWYALVERIHGTLLLGTLGDRLIEIAASLGLLLVVTGAYLWWPRGGTQVSRLFIPRFSATGRAFWKSLHSAIGGWTALVLFVFFLTGLAWAGIWGGKFVQAWSTFPAAKWDNVPLSDATHASMNHDKKEVPWALEQTLMPMSGSDAGAAGVPVTLAPPVTLETIVPFARAIGFDGRFNVKAPKDESGVWTLSRDSMSYDSTSPTSDRTVHIDRYTGKILADVGYADYSAGGKAMAVGIALHEGQLGLWNLALNLLFCAMVVTLCLSGIVMWWKRRPAGGFRLGAPPAPVATPLAGGVVLIAVLMSMAFPMLGFTLIAVLLADGLFFGLVPGLKRAVG